METETGARHRRAIIVVAASVTAVLVLAYLFRGVFAPLAVAMALAYILNPVMRWAERRRIPRGVTAVLLFFCVLAALAALVLFALPPLLSQLYAFGVSVIGEPAAEAEPGFVDLNGDGVWSHGYLGAIAEWLQGLAERLGRGEGEWYEKILLEWQQPSAAEGSVHDRVLAVARQAGEGALSILWNLQGLAVGVVLTAVYLFFFLMNFDRMVEAVRRWLPGRHRARIERVAGEIDRTVSAFLRGRILVCLAVGATTALGLALLGIPYWYLIGVVTGLAGVVPFLPIFVGLIPAVLVAWFDSHSGLAVFGTVGVFVIVQGLEGWVLTPLVQGRAVGLHPVTLTVALVLGYEMLGLFGLILAVPLAATVKILAKEFVLPEVRELADEEPRVKG